MMRMGALLVALICTSYLHNIVDAGSMFDGFNAVGKIAIGMASAGKLSGERGGVAKVSATLTKVKVSAMKIDDDKFEAVGEAIEGVAAGLTSLVSGIQSGSWVEIVTGGLDIITSLTALVDPKFAVLTSVLSMMSMVIGLFGGATGGEESTEGMLKRVIDKALTEAKADELRSKVSGVKRLYGSLSNSIKSFREAESVSDAQAMEFYTQAFKGVPFFGVIENYMNKWCDIGDPLTFTSDTDKQKMKDKANRCLEFANLYADLSLLRQILLADMAALLSQLGQNKTADNLLLLLSQEQKADMNVLKFLTNPINYKSQRYADTLFYSSLEKYPTLLAYLSKLNKDAEKEHSRNPNQKFMRDNLMICDNTLLTGGCEAFEYEEQKPNLYSWQEKISSFFVSANREVVMYESTDYRGKQYGPFYGPAVYGIIPGAKKYNSLKVTESDKDATKMMRVCDKENLDMEGECGTFDFGEYKDLANPWGPGKGSNWAERIESVSIPKGMKVRFYYSKNFVSYAGRTYGPGVINKLCTANKWKSMKVERTNYTSTQRVQICQGTKMSGVCDYIESPESITAVGVIKEWTASATKNGCSWGDDAKKVRSIKVPGGLKVELYSQEDYKGTPYGPYLGPTTIEKIDGATKATEWIKSMRITKLY